jgi:hypothetical protein
MAMPVLTINGHNYAQYIEELTPTRNDLDAEGSGRDVQTGLMYRTRIGTKQKWDVKLLRLTETIHKQLLADISPVFYQATVIDPTTGAASTKTFYTSTVPFGAQRYDKETGKPVYDGMTFSMTER